MGIRRRAQVWAAAALLGLAACAARADSQSASWQEFRVPGAGVAVSVPGAVETQKDVTAKDGNVRTLHLESKYVPSRNVTLVGTGGQPVEQPSQQPARPNPANGDGA